MLLPAKHDGTARLVGSLVKGLNPLLNVTRVLLMGQVGVVPYT
jgi:hypothetical protein